VALSIWSFTNSTYTFKTGLDHSGIVFVITDSHIRDKKILWFINKNFNNCSFGCVWKKKTEFKLILFGLCYSYASELKRCNDLTSAMKNMEKTMDDEHVTYDWNKM